MATLVALLGAMFVAMGSVSAAPLGTCNTDGPTHLGVDDTCTITLNDSGIVATSSDTDVADDTSGTITALAVGTATFTDPAVKDNPDTEDDEGKPERTYTIVVHKVAVTKIEFGVLDIGSDNTLGGDDDSFTVDNDNVFAAGTDIDVRITVSYSEGDSPVVTLSAPTTGISIESGSGTTQRLASTPAAANTIRNPNAATADTADRLATVTVQGVHVLITDGAPEGEYEVTATATNGSGATAVTSSKFSAELRIGEAGNTVGGASLALGLQEDPTDTDPTNDRAESGSSPQDGEVNLKLTVTNAIDNPANASDVDQIRVVAPFAKVYYWDGDSFEEATDNTIMGSSLSKGVAHIQIMSAGSAARSIEVYAIVLGTVAGVATTDAVPLTFTGPAASLTVDDATKTLRNVNVEKNDDDELVQDTITLLVNAEDKSGNAADPPSGLVTTIAGPDGNAIGADTISASSPKQGKDGKWRITVTNVSGNSVSAALKTGEYTLKAKSGSIEDTAMFTVAGAVDTITVDVDEMNPTELGQGLTVTAMVVDGDGAAAADDTLVNFESSDDKIAKRVGTSGNVNTKDGAASATFVVTGPGLVVITASTGGKTDSVVVNSSAGMVEPEAMPEEEASVSCLSELSGFATWSCGVEADASEIFDMVSGRGVTALHLWNGSTWVRYSVVDGAMVPGSSDFMVTKSDILYISN